MPIAEAVGRRLRRRVSPPLLGSDQHFDMNVLSRRDAFHQIASPRLETIDPCFHGIVVPPQGWNRKFTTPQVVAEWHHGRRLRLLGVVAPVQRPARDMVMAIGEDLGFHDDGFPNHPFNRKSSAIDLGPHALNYDATSPVNLLCRHASEPPRRLIAPPILFDDFCAGGQQSDRKILQ
jgi:hypothetical protein